MARPISSDFVLINRDDTDYQTTFGEAFPTTCELPLLPGPPVIALNGQPQTKPAEPGDSIVVFRAGEGPDPSSYQWQRGLKQDWTDIPGETGIEYTVSDDDEAVNVRLQQTFGDDSALYSNEIVIGEVPPKPWVDFSVIVEVTVTSSGVFSTSGFDAAFNKDTLKSEIADQYQPAIGETMIYAKRYGGGIGFTGSRCDFEFGALTNTQQVNNMQDAFKNCTKFTGVGIEYWDTSNVTSMNFAFGDTYVFNTDISGWDVSNVTNMSNMFYDAFSFNSDISNWDVSNVTNMSYMFYNAEKFSTDISNWNAGNVTNMASMFYEAALFNSDISNWNVGNVTNMESMLNSARAFNQDIDNWDVSNVVDMDYMFSYARAFNQDLSNWCVTNITSLPESFDTSTDAWTGDRPCWGHCPPKGDLCPAPWDGAEAIYHVIITDPADITITNQSHIYNLANQTEVLSIATAAAGEWIITGLGTTFKNSTGNWDFGDLTDTSNVTNMVSLFQSADVFNSDINNWDVGNVTEMRAMFHNARSFNSDLSNWNVGNVTDMSSTFRNCSNFNGNVSSWDVGNVLVTTSMFRNAQAFNSNISNWDVSNVVDMAYMFQEALAFNSDIGLWDVSNVAYMDNMLNNAQVFSQDLTGWCVDPQPVYTNFRTSSAMPSDGSYDPVWGTCPQPSAPWDGADAIYHVIVTNPADISISTADKIYNLANQAQVVSIDRAGEWIITGTDTRFRGSDGNWDFGDLTDTSNVTNMASMFQSADGFNSDLSGWDVGNVTNMSNMFRFATPFNQDISGWDVGNVTNMNNMFYYGNVFNSDISNWDVSNVTHMAFMFLNTQEFNSDVSNWDVGNVTNTSSMFQYAQAFNSDVSNWNVGNVTNMRAMFQYAIVFNQDIGNWAVGNVTNMSNMLYDAQVFNQNLSYWCVDPEPVYYGFRSRSGMPTDGSNDPVWGTCPPPPAPWEGHDGGIFHVKNASEDIILNGGPYTAWDIDGNNERQINSIATGEELVFVAGKSCAKLFERASLILPKPNWDFGEHTNTSKVTNMSMMFHNSREFNGDISDWTTGNVTDMYRMFTNAHAFNTDISNWNVGNVTNMFSMFTDAQAFNSDISNWNVSNVTDMYKMFTGALAFNIDIGNWDVSNVGEMSSMFSNAQVFNQDLSRWCVNPAPPHGLFDTNSGFAGQTTKQPQWGTCP